MHRNVEGVLHNQALNLERAKYLVALACYVTYNADFESRLNL